MKKTLSIVLSLIMVIGALFVPLTASAASVTITYCYGDEVLKTVIGDGNIDYIPESRDGKYFVGWYTDKALTNMYGIERATCVETLALTADTTLYAKFNDYIADGVVYDTPLGYEEVSYPLTGYNNGYNPEDVLVGSFVRDDAGRPGNYSLRAFTGYGTGAAGNMRWCRADANNPTFAHSYRIVNVAGAGQNSFYGKDGRRYTSGGSTYSSEYFVASVVNDKNEAILAQPNREYTFTVKYKLHNTAGTAGRKAEMQAFIGVNNGQAQRGFTNGVYPSNAAKYRSDSVTVYTCEDTPVVHKGETEYEQTFTVNAKNFDGASATMGIWINTPQPTVSSTADYVEMPGGYMSGSQYYVFNSLEIEITSLTVESTPTNVLTVDYLETYDDEGDKSIAAAQPDSSGNILFPNAKTKFMKGIYDGGWYDVQINTYCDAIVFEWDETQKCYVKTGHLDNAGKDYLNVPADGFLYVLTWNDTDKTSDAGKRAHANKSVMYGSGSTIAIPNGTKAYLYGMDLYEGWLDTTLDKSVYQSPRVDGVWQDGHTKSGYNSNAKIVIGDPILGQTAFNPEQENIALETLQASVLKGEVFLENNETQALRIYSAYTLNQFNKVFYGGDYRTIKARGIIYTPTIRYDADTFKVENIDNISILGSEITVDETTDCWYYDEATNSTVFSNYFINFTKDMYKDTTGKYSMTFASYIVLDDGTTVVSPATTFDVNKIMVESGEFDSVL